MQSFSYTLYMAIHDECAITVVQQLTNYWTSCETQQCRRSAWLPLAMQAFWASTSDHIRCPIFLSVAEIHTTNSLLFAMDVKPCIHVLQRAVPVQGTLHNYTT